MTMPRQKKAAAPQTIGLARLNVDVTAADLAAARPRDPINCALAIALRRATGRTCWVMTAKVGLTPSGPFWALPEDAVAWLHELDRNQKVAPAKFTIQLGS